MSDSWLWFIGIYVDACQWAMRLDIQLSNLVFLFIPVWTAGEVDFPRSRPAMTLSAALFGPTRPPALAPGVTLRLEFPEAVAGTNSTDSL